MRATAIALVILMSMASMASATDFKRDWETRSLVKFDLQAEVFVLYDNDEEPVLRPFQEHESSKVVLKLPASPEKDTPIHFGEIDRMTVFVICGATQDPNKPNAETEEGLVFSRLMYGVSLVFVVPEGDLVPHRWVPKKKTSSSGGKDLRTMLIAQGLIPDEDAEVFIKRGTKAFTFDELTKLFKNIETGDTDHSVTLKAKAGRKRGYSIPSTIEITTLKVSVDEESQIRVRFKDPGIVEASDDTRYIWEIKGPFPWSSGVSGIHTPNTSGTAQDFSITNSDLNPDSICTLSIKVSKPNYKDVPVRAAETQFRFSPGSGSDSDDDPFGYEGLENN